MSDAYTTLSAAHDVYENTLKRYLDSGAITAEGVTAIRREGHRYAKLVNQYCKSTMEWLAYADTVLRVE